jgi:hypothetical protein
MIISGFFFNASNSDFFLPYVLYSVPRSRPNFVCQPVKKGFVCNFSTTIYVYFFIES